MALLETVLQDISAGTFVRTQVVNKEDNSSSDSSEKEDAETEKTEQLPHIDPVTSRGEIVEVEERTKSQHYTTLHHTTPHHLSLLLHSVSI